MEATNNMRLKIISFFLGDLFVTIHLWITGLLNDLGHFGVRIVATLIIGAAGGIAAMLGKDAYPYIKTWIKKHFIKEKKKPN